MTWHKTLAVGAVEAEEVAGCEAGGRPIALYHVEGEFFATDDLCSHGQARLSEGYLENGQIECPLHQGCFDVKTGRATAAPCSIPIRTYPVKVEEGHLYVQVG
jgi:naphthalene 1,2-dioxygenase system ferredoxin subunit